ncbi:hypothetical protein FHR86_003809 [Paenarthrobacter ilicis]|uniref:Uncharacterized protein n=1 Tax=Paenarthrobacter ilicis TaxID=43665 RepID=A0ABX0TLK2_9MICC|nr:hypothetical protein [Paenarthrobacter ilicis]NIJ03450.1 hypothetical protein [Paenarthrobacter ilicis]
MNLHNITHRALGNRIELTLVNDREDVPAELVGTLLSVEHSMPSGRGRRAISTTLGVSVGGQRLSLQNADVTEIAIFDESGTKLSA